MKNTIIASVLLLLLAITACKKQKDEQMPLLIWKFALTDSTLNKTYSSDAGTYEELGYNYYTNSTFQGLGYADTTHINMSSVFRYYQTKPTYMHIDMQLLSLDTVLSKRLLLSNSLLVKQNALSEIFMAGKTYQVFNQAVPFASVMCKYTTESNQVFATNIFNPVCKGSFTVTSATVWDDGTGKAKIKVSLNYNFILQAINTGISPSQWLTETRTVTGTMQTFFTVQ